MTNRSRPDYDTSFSAQLPSTMSVPSSIDIPQFHGMVNNQGNDFVDSKEGSTHTTPLNYMRRSTPIAAVRKVEQIRERDPYHGGDVGDELEIERRFDTMHLTSNVSDDFFQFKNGGGDSLQELEPRQQNIADRDRDPEFQPLNNKSWAGVNQGPSATLDSGNRRYGSNDLLNGSQYETNYQQDLRSNNRSEISLSQHHSSQSQQSSSVSNGGYLITPPGGYGQHGEDDAPLGYKQQPNSTISSHSSHSNSSYNLTTPREAWSPTNQHQQPQVQAQSYMQGQQQQQMQMQAQNRRSGPATPSLLSSYATANAQPALAPAVLQNKYLPQAPPEYGQQNQYRPPMDDYNRRPPDRMPYGGRGGPAGPQGGYYPPPAHSQYGGMAPPPSYGVPGGHPQQHNLMSNYYSASSAAPMMPVQPDFIYQVQFKRIAKSFTNRSGTQIAERDFVVVEGDRGEDIGVVIEVMSMQEFMHRRMHEYRVSSDKDNHSVDCILRLATMHERQQLPDKFQAEKNIIQSCNELAMYGFGLPIMVYDAEFQFDRNKLTIYYECNVRIDFRDFVRQLYSTYKARIWMKIGNMNTPLEVQPLAAMALATGVQFSNGNAVC